MNSQTLFGPVWRGNFMLENNRLARKQSPDLQHDVGHASALEEAISLGKDKILIDPVEVHLVLCRTKYKDLAGKFRQHTLLNEDVKAEDMPAYVKGWKLYAAEWLHHTSFKVEEEAKRRIFQLHRDFLELRPFVMDTPRVARIVMVNHCIFADVDIPSFDETYYKGNVLNQE